MKEDEFNGVYPALAHALQSGVALEISFGVQNGDTQTSAPHSPKMLRTGVNMAMVECSALGKLMLDKGLVTEDEYRQALVDGLRAEVARYEAHLSKLIGRPISLG